MQAPCVASGKPCTAAADAPRVGSRLPHRSASRHRVRSWALRGPRANLLLLKASLGAGRALAQRRMPLLASLHRSVCRVVGGPGASAGQRRWAPSSGGGRCGGRLGPQQAPHSFQGLKSSLSSFLPSSCSSISSSRSSSASSSAAAAPAAAAAAAPGWGPPSMRGTGAPPPAPLPSDAVARRWRRAAAAAEAAAALAAQSARLQRAATVAGRQASKQARSLRPPSHHRPA